MRLRTRLLGRGGAPGPMRQSRPRQNDRTLLSWRCHGRRPRSHVCRAVTADNVTTGTVAASDDGRFRGLRCQRPRIRSLLALGVEPLTVFPAVTPAAAEETRADSTFLHKLAPSSSVLLILRPSSMVFLKEEKIKKLREKAVMSNLGEWYRVSLASSPRLSCRRLLFGPPATAASDAPPP